MRRFLIYYRLELISLLLFGGATATLAVWTSVKPTNHYVQLCFALGKPPPDIRLPLHRD